MEDLFIPYKQALTLRELGFDEPCLAVYNNPDFKWIRHLNGWEENELNKVTNTKFGSNGFVTAPLYQQTFRWFREKYNMLSNIYSNALGFLFEYHDTIRGTHKLDSGFNGPNDGGCWDLYKEAELACLKKLIEIVKNK